MKKGKEARMKGEIVGGRTRWKKKSQGRKWHEDNEERRCVKQKRRKKRDGMDG